MDILEKYIQSRRDHKIIEVEGKTIEKGDLDVISQTMREKKSGDKLRIKVTRKSNNTLITKEIILTAP